MPLGVTVILTPGANLKLFLTLKPTATASSLRLAPADTPTMRILITTVASDSVTVSV